MSTVKRCCTWFYYTFRCHFHYKIGNCLDQDIASGAPWLKYKDSVPYTWLSLIQIIMRHIPRSLHFCMVYWGALTPIKSSLFVFYSSSPIVAMDTYVRCCLKRKSMILIIFYLILKLSSMCLLSLPGWVASPGRDRSWARSIPSGWRWCPPRYRWSDPWCSACPLGIRTC